VRTLRTGWDVMRTLIIATNIRLFIITSGNAQPADGSAWVVLAQGEQMDTVMLNLLEAWCSLIFQTLQIKDLLEYLPPGTILFPHAGTHLNIAHPLWQGFAKILDIR
jgi:hypothetical protein